MAVRIFAVHYRSWYDRPTVFVTTAHSLRTLEEAKSKREVSGDLVVDMATGRIVTDETWLWEWEKEKSYAKAAIAWQKARE